MFVDLPATQKNNDRVESYTQLHGATTLGGRNDETHYNVHGDAQRRRPQRIGVGRASGLHRLDAPRRTPASVRQDAYFTHNAPLSKRLRMEYDGCGYRIHVGEHSPSSRDGDLLVVDRHGHVTRVVHQH